MEKNIFISRTNLVGADARVFLNDFEALGQHLHDLDSKWSYTVGRIRLYDGLYGAYMKLVYNNTFSIIISVDKGNNSNDLWDYDYINGSTLLSTLENPSSWQAIRGGKYTMITIHPPAPDDYVSNYSSYPSVVWFKAPRRPDLTYNTSFLNYGIGLSNYGAVLTMPIIGSFSELAASSIDCYFFEMQNVIDPEEKTWAILCNMTEGPVAETKNNFSTEMLLVSGEHLKLEKLPPEYFTSMKNRGVVPVLTNMCSKQIKYYAPHLYIKETTHDDCFGHIKIEDKYFLAGSGFCLETDEHD